MTAFSRAILRAHFPTARVHGPTRRAALRLITCGSALCAATGHHVDRRRRLRRGDSDLASLDSAGRLSRSRRHRTFQVVPEENPRIVKDSPTSRACYGGSSGVRDAADRSRGRDPRASRPVDGRRSDSSPAIAPRGLARTGRTAGPRSATTRAAGAATSGWHVTARRQPAISRSAHRARSPAARTRGTEARRRRGHRDPREPSGCACASSTA